MPTKAPTAIHLNVSLRLLVTWELVVSREVLLRDNARELTDRSSVAATVLNGMVTSVAAAVPLFFCQLQFFAKFGIFLCTTIAFSWIFANFAFMSALATFKIPIKKEGWRL